MQKITEFSSHHYWTFFSNKHLSFLLKLLNKFDDRIRSNSIHDIQQICFLRISTIRKFWHINCELGIRFCFLPEFFTANFFVPWSIFHPLNFIKFHQVFLSRQYFFSKRSCHITRSRTISKKLVMKYYSNNL